MQEPKKEKAQVGVSVLGKTYPSQTTTDKIGSAIETSNILPRAEALG
jgi:hypothetical protein